jgi:hypothetical protein
MQQKGVKWTDHFIDIDWNKGCGLIVFQWDDPFFSPEVLLDHEVIWMSIFSLAMRLLPVVKILMLEETLSKY